MVNSVGGGYRVALMGRATPTCTYLQRSEHYRPFMLMLSHLRLIVVIGE